MDFSRRIQLTSHRLAQILLIVGIIILLNYLSVSHFARLDLSAEKQFSLSEATKRTLRNLDDIVTIKVYFSQELPSNLEILSRNVRDFLNEYRAYGGSRIQLFFVDPAKDTTALKEVQTLGIPQIQVNVFEKDSIQVKQGYLGLGIFFADKQEVIPILESTATLEYTLTSAIKKVTAEEIKKVGFLSGHDEHSILELPFGEAKDQEGDYVNVKRGLEKNYEVTTVTIENGKLSQDLNTLVIGGPKKKLEDYEVLALDQYLLQGGNLLMLIDSIDLTGLGLEATAIDSGLGGLLSHLGVNVEQNAVMDISNAQARFTQQFVQWIVDYPLWPKFLPPTFSQTNPIVSRLESLVLPWSSSLTIEESKVKSATSEGDTSKVENLSSEPQVEVLIQTKETSWTQTSPFNFNPQFDFVPSRENLESLTMAALITGTFQSFFKSKSIPVPLVRQENNETPVSAEAPSFIEQSTKKGTVIVIGDSDFASDNFVAQFPQNLKFFLNIIDFVTLDPDLIAIRSKRIVERPISELSQSQKTVVRFLVIWVMPIAAASYGFLRMYRRRRARA